IRGPPAEPGALRGPGGATARARRALMPIALYMDQHVPRAITIGLRLRNVDVLTAFEDGANTLDDAALLDRATVLGRALFSQDDDLLVEATRRQAESISFGGVIYAHQ